MKRFITTLACAAACLAVVAGAAFARPVVNGATIETRTFNDCPLSTLTTSNNYPASIEITDDMSPLCVGFANLHSWSFSEDGGATSAVFNNDNNYHFGADVQFSGAGEGEGGLRLSPWYGKFVDGRFMANVTTGEIACFGGALPFYSFTGNHGITYVRGTTIHMEITYRANDLTSLQPATIQYRVVYNGNTYDSPVLAFGSQNTAECWDNTNMVYHSLWGNMNDGRAGAYFQPRANSGASLTARWTNIFYEQLPPTGTPDPNAAVVTTRTFNDCPLSTVTTSNNYPSSISIKDEMSPLCVGFANLHSWSFSDDGGASAAVFDNPAVYSFGADVNIDGAGEGEGGLRISPWYGQFVDGRFMANVTSGEIACFGGTLPFYSFTGNHGISYVRGTTIRFEATYKPHDLIPGDPATIQYRVIYNGNTYDSPVLPFGSQNTNECDHGLFGELNDARVGGYFQPRANTGAALTATWSNITFSSCFAEVALKFEPHTLNLNSHGKFVTAKLTPVPPLRPEDIDVASIRLNGTVPVSSSAHAHNDVHGRTLTVRFDREDVAAVVTAGNHVTVTVSGNINKDCFEATDVIKVKGAHMPHPHHGDVIAFGQQVDLEWATEDGAQTVSVVESYDDGGTWTVVADNVPNTGAYRWTAPNVVTNQARIGIVQILETDVDGLINESELTESETFAIGSATGVGDGIAAFTLRKIAPNPAKGAFRVTFTLPNAAPAALRLFDISGRQVVERQVGAMGAGLHSVAIGEQLKPGIYLVKLSQGSVSLTHRVIVVQ